MAPPRDARSAHPPLRWFADRADGKLSSPRAARLAEHLAGGCAVCETRDAALRRTIAALKKGPLPEPPGALRRAAVRLHTQARVAAVIDAARRVVARLVFDGLGAPALALRAAPGDERRLLWAMDRWEIDACLVTGSRGADLLGQVLPLEDTGEVAIDGELAARLGSRTRKERLGGDGRFTFRGLTPGTWTIEGRVGDLQFTLPPLLVERAG